MLTGLPASSVNTTRYPSGTEPEESKTGLGHQEDPNYWAPGHYSDSRVPKGVIFPVVNKILHAAGETWCCFASSGKL
jgi:hypothetical protein